MKIKKLFCLTLVLAASFSMLGFRYAEEPTEETAVLNPPVVTYDYQYAFDGTDVINTQSELDSFMEEFAVSGKTDVNFQLNVPSAIDVDFIHDRYVLPYVNLNSKTVKGITTISMSVTNFPGNRILYAHYTGNTSILTPEERSVYDWAKKFVNSNISADMDTVEIESIIQRTLTNHINYFSGYSTDGMQLQRYQTVIGAILDGQANCMGYSDAFTLLATLSGLEVSKQTGYLDGYAHIWNTVNIDGSWYSIDVTNNDLENNLEDQNCFAYFNMNCADLKLMGYTWSTGAVIHPLAMY